MMPMDKMGKKMPTATVTKSTTVSVGNDASKAKKMKRDAMERMLNKSGGQLC